MFYDRVLWPGVLFHHSIIAISFQVATAFQGAVFKSFLNPCKVAVCCPVAINYPKAGTFQNPIAVVICNHGAKALQRGVYQSFLKIIAKWLFTFQLQSSVQKPKPFKVQLQLPFAVTVQ